MEQRDSKVIRSLLLGGMLLKLLYTALFAWLYMIQRPLLALADVSGELRDADLLIFPSTWLIPVGICAAYWVLCLFARSAVTKPVTETKPAELSIMTGAFLIGSAIVLRIASFLDSKQMTAAVHYFSSGAAESHSTMGEILAAHSTVTSFLSILSPFSAAANDLLIIGVTAIVVRAFYLHKTAPLTGC